MDPISTIRFSAPPAGETGVNAQSTLLHGRVGSPLRAGYWTAKTGCRLQLDRHPFEFCTLLQGRVTLTDLDGKTESYSRGDSFVIPPGYRGVWDTLEACAKYFVIFDPKVE